MVLALLADEPRHGYEVMVIEQTLQSIPDEVPGIF